MLPDRGITHKLQVLHHSKLHQLYNYLSFTGYYGLRWDANRHPSEFSHSHESHPTPTIFEIHLRFYSSVRSFFSLFLVTYRLFSDIFSPPVLLLRILISPTLGIFCILTFPVVLAQDLHSFSPLCLGHLSEHHNFSLLVLVIQYPSYKLNLTYLCCF